LKSKKPIGIITPKIKIMERVNSPIDRNDPSPNQSEKKLCKIMARGIRRNQRREINTKVIYEVFPIK